jgi:hypothetical protein
MSPDLARSTMPVLWSVTLSRLALSVLALVIAVRAHSPDYTPLYTTSDGLPTPGTGMVESGPEWLSRLAAAVLVVVWVGLEATTRLDPAWGQTVRRRRMLGRPPVGPDLATAALAQVTGMAAGVAAVSAGLLLVAQPLPEYFGDLTYLGDLPYPDELGAIVGVPVLALALLAAGVLVVGTPAAVGRTLLAAATAGLAAGLVTVGLLADRLIGFDVQHTVAVLLVWVLVVLAVAGLATTPLWYRLRQRLVALVRRRPHPWVTRRPPS